MEDPNWYPKLALTISILLPIFIKLTLSCLSRNRRNPPPSPPALPVIGHLHLIKEPAHRTLNTLSGKYGKVLLLRLGNRRVLVVSSYSVVQECFTKNDVVLSDRPRMLAGELLNYNYTTVPVVNYGELWRHQRRLMTHELFSPSRIAALWAVREGEVGFWVDQMRRSLDLGESNGLTSRARKVDLKSKFAELSFNMMTMMVFGKRYYGEDDGDTEQAKICRDIMREAIEISGSLNIGDFLPFLQWLDPQGIKKKMVGFMSKMDEFVQSLVDQHRQARSRDDGEVENQAIIDNLIAAQESEPILRSDEILKGILMTLIVAGTDGSATTMEWAMPLLLNHPDAMSKLKSEIDEKIGTCRALEEQDLPKLNYLHNVIQETLRLYPPIPLLVPRQASEDCTLGGFGVARGTMVIVNAWAMHRDPDAWEDPERFRPERFGGWSEDGVGQRLVSFGGGRRGCPGAALAYRVVGLGLGRLIQMFEWERVGGEEVDMSEGLGLTMPRLKPLEAMCTLRRYNEIM